MDNLALALLHPIKYIIQLSSDDIYVHPFTLEFGTNTLLVIWLYIVTLKGVEWLARTTGEEINRLGP